MELSLVATLLVLLLYGDKHWYTHVLVSAAAFSAIAFKSVRRGKLAWTVVASAVIASNILNYWTADNHKHLLGYWCLGLALAFHTSFANEIAALAGRTLIGGCMGLATLWKVVAPDYLTGEFFEYALLTDERFRTLARLLGGASKDLFDTNAAAIAQLTSWLPTTDQVVFESTPRLRIIAIVLTWGTVVIEGLIAVAFILPPRLGVTKYRNICLLVFLLTTYLIAPVYGFAYLLIAMGMAQSAPRSGALLGYIAAFVVIQLYDAPWAAATGVLNQVQQ